MNKIRVNFKRLFNQKTATIKILQLVTKRQFRGAEVFAAELSQELIRRGHHIVFAGLYSPSAHVLEVKKAKNIDLKGKKLFFNPLLLLKLILLVRKEQPDVVQANGSDTLKYAVLTSLFFHRMKITYRNISMVSSWTKKGSFRHLFNRWLFRHVDYVTSVGDHSLRDLTALYGYDPSQASVVRRGIPEYKYEKQEQRNKLNNLFKIGEEERIIMHVGQFSSEKNHPFLIDAFEEIKKVHPSVKLILIGEGENYRKINDEVKRKNLQKDILFAGYQKEVQSWLSAADIFVLVSTIEGVPGVILEAAMQGVPAVAVNVGGVEELIFNGETGWIVEKHDKIDFSGAVLQLLQQEEQRKSFGAAAAAFVKANYSVGSCADAFEKIYEQLKNEI